MKNIIIKKPLMWVVALLLSALVAGCGGGGGGRSPILGNGGNAALAPTVTAVAPVNKATGVPINDTIITAAFSEPMAPITGAAIFTVTCATPCTSATGTLALDSTKTIATFTLTPGTTLAPLTVYTGTVAGATSIATGLALASPYVWTFTTGIAPDTTKPRVTLTVPATTIPGPTANVPINTAITAVFSEDMAPLTIAATSFTVTGPGTTAVSGSVTYVVGSRTAVFTPATVLVAGTTYTATITTAATDLAGNALAGNQAPLPAASNYIWTFATAAAIIPPPPPENVSVLSTNPGANASGVCTNASINATFSVPSGFRMDPLTVNTATFTLAATPALTSITAASVVLDSATGTIATFTPLSPLTAGVTYTATIKGGVNGVKDLAVPGDQMANDFTWNFTARTCAGPPPPPSVSILGTASTFGTFGGSAGMTNQGLETVINGNIGTTATGTSAVTGFHDTAGDIYTETTSNKGAVNGTIYTCTTSTTGPTHASVNASYCAIATQARIDAQTAYTTLTTGTASTATVSGNLAGQTLPPGVYTSGSTLGITGGNLTLDPLGDANAQWIFQIGSALTVGDSAPSSVIVLAPGQAKNVFWAVGTGAVINYAGGGTMVGTIIANTGGVTFSNPGNATNTLLLTTLNGRALSLVSSVTMVNTIINVPAP
jgi:hypothetical protein